MSSISWTQPLPVPTNPAAATGTATGNLTPGKTYYYRVAAWKATAKQGYACSEFSATADTNGSINLSWDAVVGAQTYLVWRTPTSGDYQQHYENPISGGTNLLRDECMLSLRNGRSRYGAEAYIAGVGNITSLVDLGSSTELPSGLSVYQSGANVPLVEEGLGRINVSGGTELNPTTMEEIYQDAVANGYTSNFSKIYDTGDRKIYVMKAELFVYNWFVDHSFELISYLSVYFYLDYGLFGNQKVLDSTQQSVRLTIHNPIGRQRNGMIEIRNSELYDVYITRDYGVAAPVNDSLYGSNNNYAFNGSVTFENITGKNVYLKDTIHQQVIFKGLISFDTLEISRLVRGISFHSSYDSINSTLKNIKVLIVSIKTTGVGAKFSASTFPTKNDIFRFFQVTNVQREALDCIFLQGHGLPASATGNGDTTGSYAAVKWTTNVKVLNKEGLPIVGASVEIEDEQGNTYSKITDANGDIVSFEAIDVIATNDINSGNYNFNILTTYKKHTFNITANGYEPFNIVTDIENTSNFVFKLAPLQNIDQINGEVFLKTGDGKGILI